MIQTTFTQTASFFAQGFVSGIGGKNNQYGDRKILIVNKVNENISARFDGIDQRSGNGAAYIYNIQGNTFNMLPYAVALFYPS